jgi:acyl-CoA thioesterase
VPLAELGRSRADPTRTVRTVGDTPLDRALVAEPRGEPGGYRAVIDDEWVLAVAPHGGVMAALAARAMAAELDHPAQTLRSLSAVFAGVVHAGPVDIDVSVLRRGRTVSQAIATIRNPDATAGLTAIAAFGSDRPGHEFTDLVPPEVAPPEECGSYRDPWPEDQPPPDREWEEPPFWARILECRPANGHPPWEQEWTPTTSERISWNRLDEPPVREDGTLDPLALVVVADTMPSAVGEMIGPAAEPWFAPSVDLTVHLFGPARPGWLLARNQARRATGGYASADMELWSPRPDDDGFDLVAYATQQMLFTFVG